MIVGATIATVATAATVSYVTPIVLSTMGIAVGAGGTLSISALFAYLKKRPSLEQNESPSPLLDKLKKDQKDRDQKLTGDVRQTIQQHTTASKELRNRQSNILGKVEADEQNLDNGISNFKKNNIKFMKNNVLFQKLLEGHNIEPIVLELKERIEKMTMTNEEHRTLLAKLSKTIKEQSKCHNSALVQHSALEKKNNKLKKKLIELTKTLKAALSDIEKQKEHNRVLEKTNRSLVQSVTLLSKSLEENKAYNAAHSSSAPSPH